MAERDEKTQFVGTARRGEDIAATRMAQAPEPPSARAPAPADRWPARTSQRRSEAPTDVVPNREIPPQNPPSARRTGDEERTRLLGVPSAPTARAEVPTPMAVDSSARTASSDDPVVGWLVVVEGPGRGCSIEIGVGANALGRAEDQKLSLPWGDSGISRERHAIIVYEPRSAAFYLQAGDSRNLTYVDDALVLAAVALKGGETIGVGKTKLRFTPFCTPAFNWDSL